MSAGEMIDAVVGAGEMKATFFETNVASGGAVVEISTACEREVLFVRMGGGDRTRRSDC